MCFNDADSSSKRLPPKVICSEERFIDAPQPSFQILEALMTSVSLDFHRRDGIIGLDSKEKGRYSVAFHHKHRRILINVNFDDGCIDLINLAQKS